MESTSKSIGNLYSSIDTRDRSKVLFGIMFYVQRILVVVILAANLSGGLQWSLLLLVFMVNSVIMFSASPFATWKEGVPEYLNNVIILIFAAMQAGMLS